MNFFMLIVLYAFLSALGLTLVKSGFLDLSMQAGSLPAFLASYRDILHNSKLISGLALYVVSFALWMFILAYKPLSYAFPISTGALYLAIVINSRFLLGEAISPIRLVGIIMIAFGAVLIGRTQ